MAQTERGHAVHPDHEGAPRVLRRRQLLNRVTFGVVAAVLGLVVLDGLDVVDTVGVDTETVTTFGDGIELTVEHPSVTRPALASPFEITVSREGGWEDDEQVRIAVSRTYLESWDLNGILPGPAGELSAGDGEWIVWEFDPPADETIVVTYEARIEPGVQSTRRGRVAVLDDQDRPLGEVSFSTRVMP